MPNSSGLSAVSMAYDLLHLLNQCKCAYMLYLLVSIVKQIDWCCTYYYLHVWYVFLEYWLTLSNNIMLHVIMPTLSHSTWTLTCSMIFILHNFLFSSHCIFLWVYHCSITTHYEGNIVRIHLCHSVWCGRTKLIEHYALENFHAPVLLLQQWHCDHNHCSAELYNVLHCSEQVQTEGERWSIVNMYIFVENYYEDDYEQTTILMCTIQNDYD